MPDRVVDVLQAIDVHEQDRDVVARAADAFQRVGRGAQQQQAVGQTGEGVVIGLPRQLALQVLGGRDVASDAAPVLDDTVGGAVQQEIDVERALQAVWAAEAHFARPRGGFTAGDDLAGNLIADGLQQPAGRCVADEVELVVDTEQPPSGGVGVHRGTIAIEDDDHVVGGAHHPRQPVEQQLLADALGVVERGAAIAGDHALGIVHGLCVDAHPRHSPFAVPHSELEADVVAGLDAPSPLQFGGRSVAGMSVGPRWRTDR